MEQKALASVLGVSPWTLRLWEVGRTEPAIRHWPGIVQFLGYDPSPKGTSTAERLRAVRRTTGWSQRRLADALGVDPSAVRDWEAGKEPYFRRCRAAVEKVLREFGSE